MEKIAAILLVVGLVIGAAGGFGGAFVTSINSLQSENTDLSSTLATVRSELTGSKDQLTKSQSDLSSTTTQLDSSKSKVTELNGMISSLEGDVSDKQKMIEEFEAKARAATGSIGVDASNILPAGDFTIEFRVQLEVATNEDGAWSGVGFLTITDKTIVGDPVVLFTFFFLDEVEINGDVITISGTVLDTNVPDRYEDASVVIVATDNGSGSSDIVRISFPTATPPVEDELEFTGRVDVTLPES